MLLLPPHLGSVGVRTAEQLHGFLIVVGIVDRLHVVERKTVGHGEVVGRGLCRGEDLRVARTADLAPGLLAVGVVEDDRGRAPDHLLGAVAEQPLGAVVEDRKSVV